MHAGSYMPYGDLSDGQILAAAGGFAFHTGQVSDAGTLIEAYGPLEDELAQACRPIGFTNT